MRHQRTTAHVCLQCGNSFETSTQPARRYCSRACANRSRVTTTDYVARFWTNVDRSSQCWEWRSSKDLDGYGLYHLPNPHRKVRAHRFAYELTHGTIPRGLMVCHTCDNRACVRPDHLFLGTAADNAADMVRKGRSLRGDDAPAHRFAAKRPRGERHPHAKLTADKVREMRALYAAGVPYSELAARYGITHRTAVTAVQGINWKHVH